MSPILMSHPVEFDSSPLLLTKHKPVQAKSYPVDTVSWKQLRRAASQTVRPLGAADEPAREHMWTHPAHTGCLHPVFFPPSVFSKSTDFQPQGSDETK